MWVVGAGPCGLADSMAVHLCGGLGIGAWIADAGTNTNGETTISNTPCGYGFAEADHVMVQVKDVVIPQGGDYCIPLAIRSPDIDLDGEVDSVDFTYFAANYQHSDNGSALWDRCDLNADGAVNSIDFGIFGEHYGHSCDDCP